MLKKDDIAEFRQYVKNVTPLKKSNSKKLPFKKPSQPSKLFKTVRQEELLEAKCAPYPEVSSETILSFSRSGIQHSVLRKLRQGHLSMEAILDLHGLTAIEAETALTNFILRCQQRQLRCVKIIHGKARGNHQPVLKNKVNGWLRRLAVVLAFHSAKTQDGGTGVLYVLLKRIIK